MGITADGWFDWAIRDPGPMEKTNPGTNGGKGMVPHSAEGYWPYLQVLLHSLTRRASWHASNLTDGRFYQHYPIHVRCWTSGSGYPNNNFFAFESEGMAGQPLSQAQTDNIIRVGRDLIAVQGWKPRRPLNSADLTASLYEHNECTRWGSEYTTCPSGRIPWGIIVPALQEEDDMAERVWCAERFKTYIVGKFGASPVAYPEDDKVWQALYGPHTKVMTGAELDKLAPK